MTGLDVIRNLNAPPAGLDATPKRVVFQRDKLRLLQVIPGEHAARNQAPLLLVPPLMVKPYIYDLLPQHSLVSQLRQGGFATYLVDFGVPDQSDQQVRLDDYVLDYLPTMIEQTLRHAGADQLGVVGYCMGGLFGLIHVATHHDPRICALVTIGSPVNFNKLGIITMISHMTVPLVDQLVNLLGNVPGGLSSAVFKLISLPRIVRSYANLLRHPTDTERRGSFRAINHWMNDMIPFPQQAFRQVFHQMILENQLPRGLLQFEGTRCQLDSVRAPLLAFAGQSDLVAPPAAVREVLDVVGSPDKKLSIVPGGHVGVIAGATAPAQVWQPMMEWLAPRLAVTPAARSSQLH